jgi:cobalamin biosynthesis protein CbiG
MSPTAVYALTPRGLATGRRIARDLEAELFAPHHLARGGQEAPGQEPAAQGFDSLSALVRRTFTRYDRHVFVTAAGIAVRVVAPLLAGKDADPAVVAADQDGAYVISLLSGHLGGANELAGAVARLTGGLPVITTATDTMGLRAVDTLAGRAGLSVTDPAAAKRVNALLAAGQTVPVFDPENRLGLAPDEPGYRVADRAGASDVWVGWRDAHAAPQGALRLHPRVLALGVGCRKAASPDHVLGFVRAVLADNGLCPESVLGLATIEAKAGEPAIEHAAAGLGVAPTLFSPAELDTITVPNPALRVRRHMGVDSVCEAAALALAGRTSTAARLVVEKTASRTATLAVALAL